MSKQQLFSLYILSRRFIFRKKHMFVLFSLLAEMSEIIMKNFRKNISDF